MCCFAPENLTFHSSREYQKTESAPGEWKRHDFNASRNIGSISIFAIPQDLSMMAVPVSWKLHWIKISICSGAEIILGAPINFLGALDCVPWTDSAILVPMFQYSNRLCSTGIDCVVPESRLRSIGINAVVPESTP